MNCIIYDNNYSIIFNNDDDNNNNNYDNSLINNNNNNSSNNSNKNIFTNYNYSYCIIHINNSRIVFIKNNGNNNYNGCKGGFCLKSCNPS